jgi:hypothetical protein
MPPDGPSEPFLQARPELNTPAPRTAESARGTVNVKGKGGMETWYLVGQKPGP